MFYLTNVFKKVYLFIFILLEQNNISSCCCSDCCNSCKLGGNIHEIIALAEFIDSSSILILQEILTILGLFELNSKYKKNRGNK